MKVPTAGVLARHPGAAPTALWMLPGFRVWLHSGFFFGTDDAVVVLHVDPWDGWALVAYADGLTTRAFVVEASRLRFPHEWIKNTDEPRRQPWPPGTFVQGGDRGVVFARAGGYVTAFVEAVPREGGFIRGEGPNIEVAEYVAWLKYREQAGCPGHDYEPRGYTNGAGFCRHCRRFESHVFTGEHLGQFCSECGAGTTYDRYSPDAYWDPHQRRIINPGEAEDREWRCQEHAPFRAEVGAYLAALRGAWDDEGAQP